MTREPSDPWELPSQEEPEPGWARDIRRRRRARGDRYREALANPEGDRAEPPVGEDGEDRPRAPSG